MATLGEGISFPRSADQKDFDGTLADADEAIKLEPRNVFAYQNRAFSLQRKGDIDGMVATYTKAIELDPKYAPAYNALAWLWATSQKESYRDGPKALAYARKAVTLTKWKDAGYIDTLAAANAEAGKIHEAVRW